MSVKTLQHPWVIMFSCFHRLDLSQVYKSRQRAVQKRAQDKHINQRVQMDPLSPNSAATTVKAVYLHSCHSPRSISASNPNTAFSPWQQQDSLSLPWQYLDVSYIPPPKGWDLAPPLRPAQAGMRHPNAEPASSC